MTRELHKKDVCELSENDLQTEIDQHCKDEEETLVIAAEDDRLKSLVPVKGQVTLFGTQLDFGETTEFFSTEIYHPQKDQETIMPHTNSERYHFETNSVDTLINIFSRCGQFQRSSPFMDMTRIVRPGGKLVAVTGVDPEAPADHDAHFWVPRSRDDAELETIRVLRHEDFQTPQILSVFTVTGNESQHPNAEIVST